MKKLKLFPILLCATLFAATVLPTGAAFAVAGPVTTNVAVAPLPVSIGGTVTLTATVDASGTSGLNIASASYTLNGGAPVAMSASDGAFDSLTEGVTASFSVPQGLNEVCVTGTDVGSNTGSSVCVTFTATSTTYTFTGFKSPIKMGTSNRAKAVSNVPVKWNLTLIADGSFISDPKSFVAVKSFAVDCVSGVGDPGTAVTETGPGKSGLRYLNNGNWIFNWKTPKTYSGTCREMFVLFNDGSVSPLVLFQFR